MAISAIAQSSNDSSPAVLDTTGQALERGVEYYIKPAITDNGGRFTLINRNDSCPLYVGLENVSGLDGLPVTFTPFVEEETVGFCFSLAYEEAHQIRPKSLVFC